MSSGAREIVHSERVRRRSISISPAHIHISVAVRLEVTLSAVRGKKVAYRECERVQPHGALQVPSRSTSQGLEGQAARDNPVTIIPKVKTEECLGVSGTKSIELESF